MGNVVVVHYSEIGVKRKNRMIFEKILKKNLKKALWGKFRQIVRDSSRLIIEVDSFENKDYFKKIIKNLPGVAYFSFAEKTQPELNLIKEKVFNLIKKCQFTTFKIETSRAYKKFPYSSFEINQIIGAEVKDTFKKKVDLKNPQLTIFIEITSKSSYIYLEKIYGIGGLPVGGSGRVAASLSGGIDSPVASFLTMKRGCQVIFVHIYNQNQKAIGGYEKIKSLVKELTKFQLNSRLYIVPFGDIQREIIISSSSRFRMIIYRRFMMKILNKIAKKEGAKAIITGDSLGQVASQTLENLYCIYKASDLPVLSPLIGMNKEEIVNLAKKINTYQFSIQPYPDCCSLMVASHPKTKAKIEEIEKIENNIKSKISLLNQAVKKAIILDFEFLNGKIFEKKTKTNPEI